MNYLNEHSIRRIKLVGVSFLLFFFMYGVSFTFLPLFTSQLVALGVFLGFIFYSIERSDFNLTVDRNLQIVFSLWVILFLWVFILTVGTMFKDLSLLTATLLFFIQVFIGSLFFGLWFYKEKYSFRDLMRVVQVMMLIQGVLIIIYFFSMDFKMLTVRFIPESGNVPALHPFRSRGLNNGTGANLAAFQGVGMLITSYLILKAKSWKMTLFDVMTLGILTGSVMLTGRTGAVIIPFIIAFLTLYVVYNSRISRKLLISLILFPLIILSGLLVLETVFLNYFGGGADTFSSLSSWAIGDLERLITSGESRTIDELVNEHLFFPEEPLLFLLGDPTTYALNRIPSDIGFVRRIFGTGLIGISLIYTLVGFIFYLSIKKAPGTTEKLLITVFAAWVFLLEVKEPMLTDYRLSALYMIIFCYLCIAPIQKVNLFRLSSEKKC